MFESSNNTLEKTKAIVKWYSPHKGFGFVSSPAYHEDIFLHFSVLDRTGHARLNENDEVICEIGPGKRGKQVTEIFEVILANTNGASAEAVPTDPAVEVEGFVRWFNPIKGFGFVEINPEDKDIFLHITTLRQHGHEVLAQGQRLRMKVASSGRGREVVEYTLL